MRILDSRDGFIKFEADENIFLSSFILINSSEKSYIAQVLQIKKAEGKQIAFAKILFLYNGELLNYDKTLPSLDSEIKEFTSEILQNSISAENPIIVGKTFRNDNIVIDASAFNKKMLISVDDSSENNTIIRNLVKQFGNLSKKVVILDTLGVVEAKKYTGGVDFKLPLDTASLNFMYQDCLNDATQDSKSLIIEIFKDLAEYSQTVPFVPFETLKSIIDDMVDKSHIFKLLVLKNKLAKFDKLGYFAKNKAEVEKLNHILNSDCAIIDLSKLDTVFQNRYLNFIYENLNKSENHQVILELSNVVSKKSLKEILTNSQVPTAFVTHSRFKFLNDIKNMFDNFIITPSVENNKIFNIYQTFLSSITKGTCLIAGEALNYIPFVSDIQVVEEFIPKAQPVAIETLEEELVNETATEEELVDEELPEEETACEEISEQTNISNDEILININQKSEEIISQAQEDLELSKPVDLFSEEEGVKGVKEEEEVNCLEEAELHVSESFPTEIHSNIAICEPAPEPVEETETVEEIYPQEDEIAEIEEAREFEEVSIVEQVEDFSENNEQIIELEPETQEEVVENEEASSNLEEEVPVNLEEEVPAVLDDEIEIELDESFDLDIEASEETIEEEIPEQDLASEEIIEDEMSILPISEDNSEDELDFDSIVELNSDEAQDDDILIDIAEDDETDGISEDLDKEIVEDVDKVFSTIKEDNISDSDLDFIDELNTEDDGVLEEITDGEPLEEGILEEISDSSDDGILEAESKNVELEEYTNNEPLEPEPEILETKNSSTPIVPVYDAEIPPEDMVMSDPIEQGDTVSHAKYGVGVVEKMIKYGNKTLFSINFDNVGRRLLDPTLTEIKKA